MKSFAFHKFIILLLVSTLISCNLSKSSKKPNVIFFLVDDMGWMDIGANGSTFYETPNIDALAKSGLKFTDGYAANPVCSPTRFGIQTGRYPTRKDCTNFFSGRRGGKFACAPLHDRLDHDEVTIAEALKEQGVDVTDR